MNLLNNIDCIYYCSVDPLNNTYIKHEISKFNQTFINIKNIKYKFNKLFNELPYFKQTSIFDICNDAFVNGYDYICIFSDNVNITSLEISALPTEVSILNQGDINEDCYILSNKAIEKIAGLKYDFSDELWLNKFKTFFKNLNIIYENICFHKIDYVVTFVDNTDPEWQEQYNKYSNKPKNDEYQYRDFGLLKYNILGVLENMDWVNQIYLIVSSKSQVPNYIDPDKIKIILHKDIIPGECLPTFNSRTIEMFIPNIKGLSEYFIYANDDMLVLKKLGKSIFYKEGKIGLTLMNNPEYINTDYVIACRNSFSLTVDEFPKNHFIRLGFVDEYKRFKHTPHPYLKSSCAHILYCYKDKIKNSVSRIRCEKNYNQYLWGLYDYLVGNYYEVNIQTICEKIITFKKSLVYNYAIVCLNDNNPLTNKNFYELKEKITNELNNRFKNTNIVFNKKNNSFTKCNVALCAMGKNENLYIREWVEYYKNLGITKITIYDNNDINGEYFEDVINDYIESGYVEIINVRGKTKYQLPCYIDFYNSNNTKYNWICFFDIDEFLVLNQDTNIIEYLSRKEFNDFNSIAINWQNYGDNRLLGNENNYDRNCLKRFTKPIKDNCKVKYHNSVYKKILKCIPNRNIQSLNSPHTFAPDFCDLVCDNRGKEINGKRYECDINYDLAYLKHFCTKTILEYILKSKRGGGVNGLTKQYDVSNFFSYNVRTTKKQNVINKFNNIDDTINFCVVNYNTPELINTLISSIEIFTDKPYHIYVFDNSDKTKCVKFAKSNITVFDNTNGKYINFKKWLEKYPKRFETWAKNNGWGSAKHCYTVEKCMELINKNFILLDSDILFKKDVSEIIDNSMFYVGEISQLKTQTLSRIAPYICFINVNLCNLYDIHYFNENYMHGLSKEGHNYDTGGSFKLFVNKYPHKNFKCEDYITHFGQGSWGSVATKTKYYNKKITVEDWLEEYKHCWAK